MISETHPQITDEPYEPTRELEHGLRKFDVEVEANTKFDRVFQDESGLQASNRQFEITFNGNFANVIETITPRGVVMSFRGDRGLASTSLLSWAHMFGIPTKLWSSSSNAFDSVSNSRIDLTAEWYQPTALDTGFLEVRKELIDGLFDSRRLRLNPLEEAASDFLLDAFQ